MTDTAVRIDWRVSMVNLDLVADNYMIVLEPCDCRGDPECDCVNRQQIVGACDLNTLLHNLAVAGALALAWKRGQDNGALWFAGREVRRSGP